MSSKEEILSILEAFASTERMGSFFFNSTSDFLFIRPSGNPIDAKCFQEMWSSGDLVLESAEITKLHKFKLFGQMLQHVFLILDQNLLTMVRKMTILHGNVYFLKN